METRLVGRFTLLRELGRGGMGVVWQARDEELGREVALKQILTPGYLSQQAAQERRDRMLREARAAAQLNHPGAVTVHDVIRTDDDLFIVMEYVPAPSLQELVDRDGPLAEPELLRLGLALLDVLEEAHALGIVHRDVKPANVLMPARGPKLTDFGIARLEGDVTLTGDGAFMGSPAYVSPEQARGERATPASDLWSLGVTLYFAAEGRAPFARDNVVACLAAILTASPAPPRELSLPIMGLLERDPDRRLTAEELRVLLDWEPPDVQALADVAPAVRPALTRPAIPRPAPAVPVPRRTPPRDSGSDGTVPAVPPPRRGALERTAGMLLILSAVLWVTLWLFPWNLRLGQWLLTADQVHPLGGFGFYLPNRFDLESDGVSPGESISLAIALLPPLGLTLLGLMLLGRRRLVTAALALALWPWLTGPALNFEAISHLEPYYLPDQLAALGATAAAARLIAFRRPFRGAASLVPALVGVLSLLAFLLFWHPGGHQFVIVEIVSVGAALALTAFLPPAVARLSLWCYATVTGFFVLVQSVDLLWDITPFRIYPAYFAIQVIMMIVCAAAALRTRLGEDRTGRQAAAPVPLRDPSHRA
ncbi:serine/threonine-protein kinase [Planobispora siamensis]|uniref:non-specific serine/threonine protein kinase n=1 Tax=Planobispora siamensis TaxID=936338 RepID=A0A8J3SKY1_9ACTN|nr:serine/threonine-protein kinase [Planobispora siamensis]GIH94239.1 hypothetical protein Psi01_48690 [Planobispora siamensis]